MRDRRTRNAMDFLHLIRITNEFVERYPESLCPPINKTNPIDFHLFIFLGQVAKLIVVAF